MLCCDDVRVGIATVHLGGPLPQRSVRVQPLEMLASLSLKTFAVKMECLRLTSPTATYVDANGQMRYCYQYKDGSQAPEGRGYRRWARFEGGGVT